MYTDSYAILLCHSPSVYVTLSLLLSLSHTHSLFLSPFISLSLSLTHTNPHLFNRVENAKIMIANTPMDTDKIKIYGSRVRVDSMMKVAEIEEAEKQKMRNKYVLSLIFFHSEISHLSISVLLPSCPFSHSPCLTLFLFYTHTISPSPCLSHLLYSSIPTWSPLSYPN